MKKIFRMILFWTLILAACSTGLSSPQPIPPSTTEPPTAVSTTEVSTLPPCGYQWAYQDLPELSNSFQASIQALQPEAQANAYAFGENCVSSDGTIVSFSAMETDFNVTLQVADVANENDLGEWIVKLMQVIESIPEEQIAGPQPGQVSITFQSAADQRVVNFRIYQYQALPAGLSNSEIFQALQTPQ
jgi:hypothetical protein